MLRLPRTINSNVFKTLNQQSNVSVKFLQNRQFSIFQATNKKAFTGPLKPTTSIKPLGVSKIIALATFGTATPLFLKKPVQCQGSFAQTNDAINDIIGEGAAKYNKPIFNKGEFSFGALLGLCTGFLIKKVGKIFAVFIGAAFVFMQYMSQKGYITVHWDRLEGRYTSGLGTDGRVTRRDLQTKWNTFTDFLTSNIQFKSTFLIGFYAGIRYG